MFVCVCSHIESSLTAAPCMQNLGSAEFAGAASSQPGVENPPLHPSGYQHIPLGGHPSDSFISSLIKSILISGF